MLVKELLALCPLNIRDKELLMTEALGIANTSELIIYSNHKLTSQEQTRFGTMVKRRQSGEPIAYIIGSWGFWEHNFIVTPAVLIPRPETELIIEVAQKMFAKDAELNILDLGTGSGCIIISLLHEFVNSTGTAVDISTDALAICQENAQNIGVINKLKLIESNWFKNIPIDSPFDLIISNPPYIAQNDTRIADNVQRYEPHKALFAENNGLAAYKQIAQNATRYLADGGKIIVEIGMGQTDAVCTVFCQHHFTPLAIYQDLAQIDRCIVFCKNTP